MYTTSVLPRRVTGGGGEHMSPSRRLSAANPSFMPCRSDYAIHQSHPSVTWFHVLPTSQIRRKGWPDFQGPPPLPFPPGPRRKACRKKYLIDPYYVPRYLGIGTFIQSTWQLPSGPTLHVPCTYLLHPCIVIEALRRVGTS